MVYNLPKISVVLPVYNSEKYVLEAIDSILGQTYRDFELIVIDDGSTDTTAKILQTVKDIRIRIIRHIDNRGLVAALNHGIKEAKGQYLARMDADDISLPTRFCKQVTFMDKHPEVAVCGTFFQGFDGGYNKIKTYPTNAKDLKCFLLFGSQLAHPSVMIRTEMLNNYHYRYDMKFNQAEDYDLWERMSANCQFTNLPEILLLHRVHPAKKSLVYARDLTKDTNIVRLRQIKKLGLNPTPEEERYHYLISEGMSMTRRDKFMGIKWLIKLWGTNLKNRFYPEPSFTKLLISQIMNLVKI